MEDDKKVAIIKLLAAEKVEDKATIDQLQKTLRNQLECTVGGAGKVANLILTFGEASKKTFLSAIEDNPDVYKTVRAQTILFEDIAKMDDGDIKKLIGALNLEVLAASIAKDDSESSKKLSSNLSGAAQAMVQQFIDLKKESLSDVDVSTAQDHVVLQLKQLSDDGQVDIVSKLVG